MVVRCLFLLFYLSDFLCWCNAGHGKCCSFWKIWIAKKGLWLLVVSKFLFVCFCLPFCLPVNLSVSVCPSILPTYVPSFLMCLILFANTTGYYWRWLGSADVVYPSVVWSIRSDGWSLQRAMQRLTVCYADSQAPRKGNRQSGGRVCWCIMFSYTSTVDF